MLSASRDGVSAIAKEKWGTLMSPFDVRNVTPLKM